MVRPYTYTFTLKVEDSIVTATATETKTVTAVNEFTPSWSAFTPAYVSSTTPYTIDEIISLGTSIVTIAATDSDHGTDGQIIYSVSDPVTADNGVSVSGLFQINTNTGVLSTSSATLDRDPASGGYGYFDLTVTASDQGSPALSVNRGMRISLNDLNDNAPVCSQAMYSVSVNENVALSTSVVTVVAIDNDATAANNVVTYTVTGGDGNAHFTVNLNTGVLSTSASLDYEGKTNYEVEITAQDSGSPTQSSTCTVQISINDLNDNAPVCSQATYSTSVNENVALSTSVVTVVATDNDATAANNVVTYTVTGGDGNAHFTVNVNTGVLSTSASLDYEGKTNYEVEITAQDSGSPTQSSTCTVQISINDLNDNAPVCSQATYSTSVNENVALSTSVVTVVATDNDATAANNVVTYTVTGGDGNAHFTVNVNTGVLSTSASLDYEGKTNYNVEITAQDSGSPTQSSTCTVQISINDLNDNAPVCSQATYSTSVNENVALGTSVVTLIATDNDATAANNVVTYTVTGGDGNAHFTVNVNTGVLSTSASLDYEGKTNYEVEITAQDSGSPTQSSTCTVQISINDLNDNAPVCSQATYSTSVNENVALGTSVVTLIATDNDATAANSVVTYTVTGGDGNAHFTVNVNTCVLSTSASLDYEGKTNYEVEITAQDSGSPTQSSTCTVQISMNDLNDNAPTFTSGSLTISVSEASSIGTTVTTVLATDADSSTNNNNQVDYSFSAPSGQFNIRRVNGVITLTASLDRELVSSYMLIIRGEDQGSPTNTGTTTLTVSVTDVNDNTPVFSSTPYSFNVLETVAISTPVGQVQATDADIGSNSVIIFAIQSTISGNSSHFNLDPSSGIITTTNSLDREIIALHKFEITATDGGSPALIATSTLTITIDDVNDNAPVFTSLPYSFNPLETVTVGTSIAQVQATDSDIGINSVVTFAVISTISGDSAHFNLDPNSGEITTLNTLDRENIALYEFRITASDSGSPALVTTSTITIAVADVNDNTPIFTSAIYVFNCDETIAVSTSIGQVQGTDADIGSNGVITFAIANVIAGNSSHFNLDPSTGIITNTLGLDREILALYEFEITATDGGSPALTATSTLTITVTDVNDNPPTFDSATYSISTTENQPIGTSLLTVTVNDADIGSNALYTLSIDVTSPAGIQANSFMQINTTTGLLSLTQTIDRESTPSFNFNLVATDQGVPALSSTASVSVTVLDVNDNSPIFTASVYTFNISEAAAISTFVGQVLATDTDAGLNSLITYTINTSLAGNLTHLSLDNNTGIITTFINLDRETTSLYEFLIKAIDGGASPNSATCTVTIYIDDDNDNTPIFDSGSYSVSSTENSVVGTSILTVTVTDIDFGLNADVLLSIDTSTTEGASADLFIQVNSTSMTLSVKQVIDREIDPSFNFTLIAVDQGTPALNSSTDISISIDDLNDNNPIFSQSDYLFNITEAAPIGTSIGTVIATDADIGGNANITYIIESFSAGDNHSLILYQATGIIATTSNIDRETTDLYIMTAVATDDGLPSLNNTATVTIVLLDANDNVPLFSSFLYEAFILENSLVGTSILSVNVSDADIGINGGINLNIDISTPEGVRADQYIEVNSSSLIVSVKQINDFETDPNFVFHLIATDQGTPALNPTAVINITINDTNDNEPIFSPLFYSTEIAYNDHCQGTVVTVTATDADSGVNSDVTFITSRPYNTSLYDLNGNTGDVTYVNTSDADGKYLIYIMAFDGGSPQLNTTFEAIARIDTYDPNDVILKYHMDKECVNFTANEQTFLTQLSAVYNTSYRTSYARRWCLDNSSSISPCIVYIYVVANDTADEVTELNNTKYFVHADDALKVTSNGGNPADVISGPLWALFGITKVEKYKQPVTDDKSSTPWFQTPAGIAALTVLSLLGVAGIGAIMAKLIHSYVNQPPLNKKIRKLNKELRKQRRRERRQKRRAKRREKRREKRAASNNGPENQRFDNSVTRVSINEGFTETDPPFRAIETESANTNVVSGSQVRILEVEPISNV